MGDAEKLRCFVVQGFGTKTDFRTGRQLNLDDSYEIIKEAVEAAGLECIRADKVMHSGSIDVEMWEQILGADLVVADVSTSNWNAAYELGVRHALCPGTTIVVAEEQFEFAFDINHIAVTTYRHGGPELGRHEANRFRDDLTERIRAIIGNDERRPDSPVFLSLPGLQPPQRTEGAPPPPAPEESPAAVEAEVQGWDTLRDQALAARDRGDWVTAKTLLAAAHAMVPREDYITQQLALATYKSQDPSSEEALAEAREILNGLRPSTSHDPETLGLWAAVHKSKWFIGNDPADLDEAIKGNEKGFYLKGDHYNGINLAFLLNVRAALPYVDPAEAIADHVTAQRVRRRVTNIVEGELAARPSPDPEETDLERRKREEEAYWLLATLREAAVGLGDGERAERLREDALATAPEQWMLDSTDRQIATLEGLLAFNPLQLITGTVAEPEAAAVDVPAEKDDKDEKAAKDSKAKKKKKKTKKKSR